MGCCRIVNPELPDDEVEGANSRESMEKVFF